VTEVACDESGFTGGNLTSPGGVFAHATVSITSRAAADVIDHLRRHTRAPAGELKANWLLRTQCRADVRWLLSTGGPLAGSAQVHLSDTRYFLLARILDVLLDGEPVAGTDLPGRTHPARSMAALLRLEGPTTYGEPAWQDFLIHAGNLVRMNRRRLPRTAVQDFDDVLRTMIEASRPGEVRDVLVALQGRSGVVTRVRQGYLDNPKRTPLLEPLIPALTRAVLRWGAGTRHLHVLHDEQSALTAERVGDIAVCLDAVYPGHTLSVSRVDSLAEPRVQIADLVAGIARRAARDVLLGRSDLELMELVTPFVDAESVWPRAAPVHRVGS
jgi:hypothetical protein